VGIYFIGVGALEGQKLDQIFCKLSASFLPVVAADLLIWPIFTVFVFHNIPVNWQAITFACMEFFYDLFLSLVNHSDLMRKLNKYLALPCKHSSSSDLTKESISLQPLMKTQFNSSSSSIAIEIREILEL